jgi:hypothetical protein
MNFRNGESNASNLATWVCDPQFQCRLLQQGLLVAQDSLLHMSQIKQRTRRGKTETERKRNKKKERKTKTILAIDEPQWIVELETLVNHESRGTGVTLPRAVQPWTDRIKP